MNWQLSYRADPAGNALAKRHYSSQSPDSDQFVPTGACLVFVIPSVAVWVTSWPLAEYVKHAWPGAWINSLFRNERRDLHLSSSLISDAIAASLRYWSPPAWAHHIRRCIEGAPQTRPWALLPQVRLRAGDADAHQGRQDRTPTPARRDAARMGRAAGRGTVEVDRVKFAYADSPYLMQCKLYGHAHPEGDRPFDGRCWDEIETHQRLIDWLTENYYDGWAMSMSTPTLRPLLARMPIGVRIGAWVKPFASFKPGINPAYCWEPVAFRGGEPENETRIPCVIS